MTRPEPSDFDAGSVATSSKRAAAPPHVWVTSTYFAEGYPYTIVNSVADVLFKELGVSLGVIGLTSLFHLPWNLKFLWGPLLDRYETKRRWLVGVEAALVVVLLAIAAGAESPSFFAMVAGAFLLLAVLSATHDIAIDGYYLEALDEKAQSRFVGLRAMAYKVSSLVVRGPLLVLVGVLGWTVGLATMALVMLALLGLHAALLPRPEVRRAPIAGLARSLVAPLALAVYAACAALVLVRRLELWPRLVARVSLGSALAGLPGIGPAGLVAFALLASLVLMFAARKRLAARGDSSLLAPYLAFLAQPRARTMLAFVVLFRTGESFLQKMKYPFLVDYVHLSVADYGFINGTVGLIASFGATLLGGALIARHGLRRWVWPFVLMQNVLNLLYVFLATTHVTKFALTIIIALEHFGEGLGTAVFMVYLMRCCDPSHKAAHMALLTALMSVSFTVAGVVSGYLAEALGYARYFSFSFVATVPSMVLLFFVPYLDGRRPAAAPGEAAPVATR